MTTQELDFIKELYKKYLLSNSKYLRRVCNKCGWMYSHPLNYCAKCPGRIIYIKPIILDEIKQYLPQDGMIRMFLAGFGEFYEDNTGTTFPYGDFEYPSKNYYDLRNILMIMLGKNPVNLDDFND